MHITLKVVCIDAYVDTVFGEIKLQKKKKKMRIEWCYWTVDRFISKSRVRHAYESHAVVAYMWRDTG